MLENVISMLLGGGPVVWLLLVFSMIALTVSLMKLAQLFALRQRPLGAVDRALVQLENGYVPEAQLLARGQANPRVQVLRHALEMFEAEKFSVTDIRNEALRRARLGLATLESHLRVLEIIAMLAPLLGLFGTVLGMIEAFRAMESAGSQVDPAILSGGIWQALLTTAFGLAVAIPVSIAHSWFERKLEVQAAAQQNDIDVITAFINQKPWELPTAKPLLRAERAV